MNIDTKIRTNRLYRVVILEVGISFEEKFGEIILLEMSKNLTLMR